VEVLRGDAAVRLVRTVWAHAPTSPGIMALRSTSSTASRPVRVICNLNRPNRGSRRYQGKIFGKEDSDEITVGC
jgi:hypothetical protein